MSDRAETTHLVLTGVRSRSHLVYASSYLRHVLDSHTGRVRLTVLSTGDAFGDGGTREAAVRGLLVDSPRLVLQFSDTGDQLADLPSTTQLLCVGAPSIRAWSSFVRSHHGRRPRVVVVDEGLGSYGTWLTRRSAYIREGGRQLRSTVRAMAVATSARWLTDVRWSLYASSPRGWRVDERVAQEFRRRLEGEPPPHHTAVYLTQPWVALGVMSQQTYAAHLAEVRSAASTAGLRLVLRTHPWERPEAYAGFDLVAGSAPAELDRGVVGASLVIGGNSTALLNLSAVHGVPAVRVLTPELAGLDAALGGRQRSLLDTFLPPVVPLRDLPRALARKARHPDPQQDDRPVDRP